MSFEALHAVGVKLAILNLCQKDGQQTAKTITKNGSTMELNQVEEKTVKTKEIKNNECES